MWLVPTFADSTALELKKDELKKRQEFKVI